MAGPVPHPRLAGYGLPVYVDARHKAGHERLGRLSYLNELSIVHVNWLIFPEYVGGRDKGMVRHRAQRQGLAGEQSQCQRPHLLTVSALFSFMPYWAISPFLLS